MTDESDPYIPCCEAVKLVRSPRGRKTHTATIVRWALAGKVRAERRGRWWFVHRGDVLVLTQPVRREPAGQRTRREQSEAEAWTQATLARFGLA